MDHFTTITEVVFISIIFIPSNFSCSAIRKPIEIFSDFNYPFSNTAIFSKVVICSLNFPPSNNSISINVYIIKFAINFLPATDNFFSIFVKKHIMLFINFSGFSSSQNPCIVKKRSVTIKLMQACVIMSCLVKIISSSINIFPGVCNYLSIFVIINILTFFIFSPRVNPFLSVISSSAFFFSNLKVSWNSNFS